MIVYGSSFSPYVRKVLAAAAEKEIELTLKPIGLQAADPEFRAASPFGKMPALRDGDFTVSDSTAIVAYFEAVKPEPALIPAEAKARARTIWYEEFADTILLDCMRKSFFNRVVAPRFLGMEGDLAVAEKAEREEFPPLVDYVESVLPDAGWLVGDALTLADIAVASPFVNMAHVDVTVDPATHPKTATWLARVHARPSFAKWIAGETAFLRG